MYVQAPGAGSLQARRAAARWWSASPVRMAPAPPRHRAPCLAGARAHARRSLTRTVATGTTDTKGAGLTTLTLTLAPRYAALARERGGLSATVTVTFSAPGHADAA